MRLCEISEVEVLSSPLPPARPDVPAWVDRAAYPFESRTIDLAAGRVHYVDQGPDAGKNEGTLLFVHGTPTWSFEYRHLIAALSATHRCIAPDHLGFGLSSRPRDFPYTPEAHALVLRELVTRLGLDDITLVLHDFGGPIGLPLALEDDSRVRRLVLFNTWAWPFDDDAAMTRVAKITQGPIGRLLYGYANASLRIVMPSAYGDRRKLTPAIHDQYLCVFPDRDSRVRVLHTLARALLGSRDHYARLWARLDRLRALPTLIVWGLKDTAFKPYMLDHWREALPSAHVVVIPDAGHWPHEEDPEASLHAMRAFLA